MEQRPAGQGWSWGRAVAESDVFPGGMIKIRGSGDDPTIASRRR